MPPAIGPAPLTLVLGSEDLLVDRAVAGVKAAVLASDSDADLHDLAASCLEPGALAELTSPSLFATRRLVILRGLHEVPSSCAAEVEALIADPGEDVAVVLVHPGGAKGKALVDAAKKCHPVVVDAAEVKKPGDKLAFVSAEFRLAGRRIDGDAARALLDAVGGGLRELAAAAGQLVADTSGAVDVETVARYYEGRAEVTSFKVADLAIEGRTGEALAALRWALSCGVEPVLLTSALAMGVRNIAKLGSAPRGMNNADLARDLGMPPWKIDQVRKQLRGWDGEGVAQALTAVAAADAAVKGGAVSTGYAIESAVVAVAAARRG
ncbi:MAG: DNA polymerase III subunit delta [Sporichthyaceae bacterium]